MDLELLEKKSPFAGKERTGDLSITAESFFLSLMTSTRLTTLWCHFFIRSYALGKRCDDVMRPLEMKLSKWEWNRTKGWHPGRWRCSPGERWNSPWTRRKSSALFKGAVDIALDAIERQIVEGRMPEARAPSQSRRDCAASIRVQMQTRLHISFNMYFP